MTPAVAVCTEFLILHLMWSMPSITTLLSLYHYESEGVGIYMNNGTGHQTAEHRDEICYEPTFKPLVLIPTISLILNLKKLENLSV
jgi:hypothetical protein